MIYEIVLLLATLFGLLYYYITSKWKYWTKRGVYQIPPTFPFGTMTSLFTRSKAHVDLAIDQGKMAENRPYYGGYFLTSPILTVQGINYKKI